MLALRAMVAADGQHPVPSSREHASARASSTRRSLPDVGEFAQTQFMTAMLTPSTSAFAGPWQLGQLWRALGQQADAPAAVFGCRAQEIAAPLMASGKGKARSAARCGVVSFLVSLIPVHGGRSQATG
jgi:hypothetical protein